MDMPGHAIIVRRDLSVFAHVHPSGTAPMASIALAQHAPNMVAQHTDNMAALPATVTFPYGFPRAGEYRLFVQVKRSAGVQTGVFDVRVAEP
jgi:hypothetical protein